MARHGRGAFGSAQLSNPHVFRQTSAEHPGSLARRSRKSDPQDEVPRRRSSRNEADDEKKEREEPPRQASERRLENRRSRDARSERGSSPARRSHRHRTRSPARSEAQIERREIRIGTDNDDGLTFYKYKGVEVGEFVTKLGMQGSCNFGRDESDRRFAMFYDNEMYPRSVEYYGIDDQVVVVNDLTVHIIPGRGMNPWWRHASEVGEEQIWTGRKANYGRAIPRLAPRSGFYKFRHRSKMSAPTDFYYKRTHLIADGDVPDFWLEGNDDFGNIPLVIAEVTDPQKVWDADRSRRYSTIRNFIDMHDYMWEAQWRYMDISCLSSFPFNAVTPVEFLNLIAPGGECDPLLPANYDEFLRTGKWNWYEDKICTSEWNLLIHLKFANGLKMQKFHELMTHPLVFVCLPPADVALDLQSELGLKLTICETLRKIGVRFESCVMTCAVQGGHVVYAAVVNVIILRQFMVCSWCFCFFDA